MVDDVIDLKRVPLPACVCVERSAHTTLDLGEALLVISGDPFLRGFALGLGLCRHEPTIPTHGRLVDVTIARNIGDLAAAREAVDRQLRTRRHLDYHATNAWAEDAGPTVAELRRMADTAPSLQLVELLQRGVGHLVKVMLRADDSNGFVGDLADDLLEAHARCCDAGAADSSKLAAWMVRFSFKDQDFFFADPVRYASPLGPDGLAAYRSFVDQQPPRQFATQHARVRLAVLDRDVEALVMLVGGDLRHAGQCLAVAEAMCEVERPDLAVVWVDRGLEMGDGYPAQRLYDLACDTHERLGQPLEALRMRRAHHQRTPSAHTYATLKAAAEAAALWPAERDAARIALRGRDPRGYVTALLHDQEPDAAWIAAQHAPIDSLTNDLWVKLADLRRATNPAEALKVYLDVADEILITTDRGAYVHAIRVLKKAKAAAAAADLVPAFNAHVNRLCETHRRRPSLIALFGNAALTDPY